MLKILTSQSCFSTAATPEADNQVAKNEDVASPADDVEPAEKHAIDNLPEGKNGWSQI